MEALKAQNSSEHKTLFDKLEKLETKQEKLEKEVNSNKAEIAALKTQFMSLPAIIDEKNKVQTLELENKLTELINKQKDDEHENKLVELKEFKKMIIGAMITFAVGFVSTAVYIALRLK